MSKLLKLKTIISSNIIFGDYTLSSGQKSKFYVDCRPILLSSKTLKLVADVFVKYVSTKYIATTGMGGLSIANAMAARHNYEVIYVRESKKEYGTKLSIEKPHNFPILNSNDITIVDDVLTTGNSIRKCGEALNENHQPFPSGTVVLVNRSEPLRQKVKTCVVKSIFRIIESYSIDVCV